nr:cobalamin-dependent protein [Anaerotalea alkaliphila]
MQEIRAALEKGQSARLRELLGPAVEAGTPPDRILRTMLEVMEQVGKGFKEDRVFIPEVLMVGRAFNLSLDFLAPLLGEGEAAKSCHLAKAVLGTVKGDIHDIGKNLVKLMFTGSGVEVVDLGVDVSPEAFVEAVRVHKPDILAMSALLTTTMPQQRKTIRALEKAGLRQGVAVFVGGAPVTEAYAREIGADYYSSDAGEAMEMARVVIDRKKAGEH